MTSADAGSIWCVADYNEGIHESERALLTVVGKDSLEIPHFIVHTITRYYASTQHSRPTLIVNKHLFKF